MNKAQQTAIAAASVAQSTSAPYLAVDTDYTPHPRCWVVNRHIVVYEDEPDCIVSIAARDGRLVACDD